MKATDKPDQKNMKEKPLPKQQPAQSPTRKKLTAAELADKLADKLGGKRTPTGAKAAWRWETEGGKPL